MRCSELLSELPTLARDNSLPDLNLDSETFQEDHVPFHGFTSPPASLHLEDFELLLCDGRRVSPPSCKH